MFAIALATAILFPSAGHAAPPDLLTIHREVRELMGLAAVERLHPDIGPDARFEKTGDRAIEFEIAYLLERAEESWRVMGHVSARDQEEEMKALGLL